MIGHKSNIFWYPCNVVGYVRLGLLAAVGLAPLVCPGWTEDFYFRLGLVGLLALSRLLDGLDGYLARRFGHSSQFGAMLDLAVDLATHTLMWLLSGLAWAVVLITLEWTAGLYMAAFSQQSQVSWKKRLVNGSPALIQFYFSQNQRNVLSGWANVCHFLLPMSWYIGLDWLAYLTLPGLILYEAVTLYILYVLIKLLARGSAA